MSNDSTQHLSESDEFRRLMESLAQRHEDETRKAQRAFAQSCVPVLVEAGVHTLVVAYSGSGDSGGIDYVDAYDKDSGLMGPALKEVLTKYPEVRRAIDDYAYSLMPAGFEINEGSDGEISFDVETGTWSREHNQNVLARESHCTEGRF